MKKNQTTTFRAIALVAAVGMTASACGDDAAAGPEIDGAWARTSPMSAEAGAAYFQISSDEDDVLIGASVDPSIASVVELHETQMMDQSEDDSAMDDDAMEDDSMDDMNMEEGEMDMGDVMTMVEVGTIDLPAGETVSLEPGGLHVMLLDLAEPLEEGETFDLTLDFENADDQVVTVTVGDSAPE